MQNIIAVFMLKLSIAVMLLNIDGVIFAADVRTDLIAVLNSSRATNGFYVNSTTESNATGSIKGNLPHPYIPNSNYGDGKANLEVNVIKSGSKHNISGRVSYEYSAEFTKYDLFDNWNYDWFGTHAGIADVNISTRLGGVVTVSGIVNTNMSLNIDLFRDLSKNGYHKPGSSLRFAVGTQNVFNGQAWSFINSDMISGKAAANFTFVEENPMSIVRDRSNLSWAFGKSAVATFVPRNSQGDLVSLDDLASELGYDRFNWVQWVTSDNDPGRPIVRSTGKQVEAPYLDPPPGGYIYKENKGHADNNKGYWDTTDLNSAILTDGVYTPVYSTNRISMIDAPVVTTPGSTVYFQTALAVEKRIPGSTDVYETTIIGPYTKWKSTSRGTESRRYSFDESIVEIGANELIGIYDLEDLSFEDRAFLSSQGILMVPEPSTYGLVIAIGCMFLFYRGLRPKRLTSN